MKNGTLEACESRTWSRAVRWLGWIAVIVGLPACAALKERMKVQTLPAFPTPIAGSEVDEFLPQVRTAMESDLNPQPKVLRVESAQRQWQIVRHEITGLPLRRQAAVHTAFELEGKCYYQPRMVVQSAVGGSWSGVKLADWMLADTASGSVFATKSGDMVHPGGWVAAAHPLDCAAVNVAGPKFYRCPMWKAIDRVCEEGNKAIPEHQ
jgi:hypothetical protein